MAYAPHELVAKWRGEAAKYDESWPRWKTNAAVLRRAAEELERYHHEDNHDGEWVTSGCPLCDKEREKEER